jgi:hypothetical protein
MGSLHAPHIVVRRLIQFDKRGIGLSDPAPHQSLPTLEEWMDDLRGVLDAVDSERTTAILSVSANVPRARPRRARRTAVPPRTTTQLRRRTSHLGPPAQGTSVEPDRCAHRES